MFLRQTGYFSALCQNINTLVGFYGQQVHAKGVWRTWCGRRSCVDRWVASLHEAFPTAIIALGSSKSKFFFLFFLFFFFFLSLYLCLYLKFWVSLCSFFLSLSMSDLYLV